MIDYKEKATHISYDVSKVEEALTFLQEEFITSNNSYGWSQETAIQMNALINGILDSIEKKEIYIDEQRKETEEEAKEYFGEDFINKFEELRKMCEEQNITLAIHGTDIDCAKKIQQQGLHYKNPQLLSTTVFQPNIESQPQYQKYSDLLNWPHRQYKGLVLVGVPNECCGGYNIDEETGAKPLWEYKPTLGEKTGYEQEYTIKPEFIIGYINVEKKEILSNTTYTTEHDYTGLKRDTDVTYEVSKETEIEVEQEFTAAETKAEPVNTRDTKKLTSKEMLVDAKDILSGIFHNLQRSGNDGMLQKRFSEFLRDIEVAKENIQFAIPELKTNQQIDIEFEEERRRQQEYQDKLDRGEIEESDWDDWIDWDEEIDEAISEVTLHEINDITKEVKSSELETNREDLHEL